MAATIAPAIRSRGRRQFTLAEWFGLRRHALPDFFDSVGELPAELSSLAEAALPPGHAVRGALFVPAEYVARRMLAWEYVPERALVFLDGAALFVRAEGPETPAETMFLDAHSLLYVRSSLLLLYGLLEFKADCGPQPNEVRLEYNTVIWRALGGPLARFVSASCSPFAPGDDKAVRAANDRILKALPFKFANGLRYYALDPGERLLAAVFQPAIWERRAFFSFQVTPNTLFGLTEGKVVLIEESRSPVWRRSPQGEYGWIFTYIPRDRVVDMVVTPHSRYAEVRVELARGAAKESRSLVLEPGTAVQLERSWREFESPVR